MPKYRKLYTKIVESFDFNDMPDDFHRLFWTLLPLVASREGTLPDYPTLILSKVFPMRRDVEAKQVEAALDWFAAHDMIRYYEAKGRRYIWIVNFAEYQGVTEKEAASEYPPVPESVKTYSGPIPDLLQSKSRLDSYSDADANSNADVVAAAPTPEPPQPPPPDPAVAEVFRAWENANGLATATHSGLLLAMIDEYGGAWVRDAIGEAAASTNRFAPRYIESILQRWKRDGKGNGKARASPGDGGKVPRAFERLKEIDAEWAKEGAGET
jgi:hypothetical protein